MSRVWTSKLCIVILLLLESVSCASFDSIASMKALMNPEPQLLTKIQALLTSADQHGAFSRLGHAQRLLDDLNAWVNKREHMTHAEWELYSTTIVEHPVNALNIIRTWSKLRAALDTPNFKNILNECAESRTIFPDEEDYEGAIAAIIRLQKTYALSSSELARGVVLEHQALHGITPDDMLKLAVFAMDVDHGIAASWFQQYLATSPDDTEGVMEYLEKISQMANKWVKDKQHNSHLLPDMVSDFDTFQHSGVDLDDMVKHSESLWRAAQPYEFWDLYEGLCRGDYVHNNILLNKDLRCLYRRGKVPYVQYKEEIHSISPRISLFLDVITDRQADIIREKAVKGLYRAQVGGVGSVSTTSTGRVGRVSWLYDSDDDFLTNMSRVVSDLTGLSTKFNATSSTASEGYQIGNYGVGGQYEPHHDFLDQSKPHLLNDLPEYLKGTGYRIATFMLYLYDTTAGGATVFPELHVRVPPVKNAAAYWYNFDLAGETGDTRTLHAGCPVLLGQKWIGNVWLRQHGQMFTRPCGLNKDAIDPIRYN